MGKLEGSLEGEMDTVAVGEEDGPCDTVGPMDGIAVGCGDGSVVGTLLGAFVGAIHSASKS